MTSNSEKTPCKNKKAWVRMSIVMILYLLFLLWVGSWWGLIVVPFIFDTYVTKKIPWSWWRKSKNSNVRFIMGWVDAIVFALVAVYFINNFFFQNFVIPSSSLEKTLLTGDYLLVSKLSYGPRIPQTPLTMPLTQNTMPITGGKSYLEWPSWDYRRVKGLGHPRINDIVVFNYPAGDTVALNAQDQDFYRLAYQTGAALDPTDTITPGMNYEEQQALFSRLYEAGKKYMKENEDQFGKIISRPADRCENYVKRCVGLPGQTLQIKHNVVYLDGKANREPNNSQYRYFVQFANGEPSYDFCKDNGITQEDLSVQAQGGTGITYVMPLTTKVKRLIMQNPSIGRVVQSIPSENQWLYPLNMAKSWSTSDYGPIWIPKRGATLKLTLENLPIYERPIRAYEGNKLEVRNHKIYINNREATTYTFKLDYYWMMGDNRDNSADSRFWGFVPENHVVGKPLFIWLSLDKDYGWFSGKIRWNRLFKWVGDIQ